jgi:hypothetical protein
MVPDFEPLKSTDIKLNGTVRSVLSDIDAHNVAMELPIAEVVRKLVDLLGLTLVALIGGVTETRAVQQWLTGRVPQRPNVLRFALQMALMIAMQSDREMARAWFECSNPLLEDSAPALLLRSGTLADNQALLMAAARSFAARKA